MQDNKATTDNDERMNSIRAAWRREEFVGLYIHKSGDYAEFATSEPDVIAPNNPIQFFVPLVGGEVTADFCDRTVDPDTTDQWTYDIPIGVTLTAEQVEKLACWDDSETGDE